MQSRLRILLLSLLITILGVSSCSSWQGREYHPERGVASSYFGSDTCRDNILSFLDINLTGARGVKRAPFGVSQRAAEQGKHLQFGFESEYTLNQIDGIVTVYGPKPEFGITSEQWFAMSVQDRSQWVRDNIQTLFPSYREAGGLVKMSQDDELAFLPDALILDDTRNLEFVLDPFDTLEEWHSSVSKLNEKFGFGSMQGTVSVPRGSFFGELGRVGKSKTINNNLGMFKFYQDFDTLQKLSGGYERFQRDSSKKVANSFEHPFLGPITEKKQKLLLDLLDKNSRKQGYEPERLARISDWENSYKYTGGTVYRPDILGRERVVLEVRDAHKNFALLLDRMLRTTYYMQEGRQGLSAANNLKPFDSEKDFNKLPKKVQNMLEDLFPNKAVEGIEYGPDQLLALDVFRNFAYPLRDWSEHVKLFPGQNLRSKISQARKNYENTLKSVVQRLKDEAIDKEAAAVEVHGALAKFSDESGLAKAFEKYEDEVIFGNPAHQGHESFIRRAAAEAGPLQQAFPEEVWTGELEERMLALQTMYPNNLKKVKNVGFKMANGATGNRDLWVVSLQGLEDREQFLKDYLEAVSQDTVSFPLSKSPGHLYTRLGNKTYDYLSGVSQYDYRFPNGKRLESFLVLTAEQQMNLRTYVENARNDVNRVVGSFSMNGAKGATGGRLDNNLPTQDSGHNCTSWLCTSPINPGSGDIVSLVGARRSYNIHTNPGWWQAYLSTSTSKEIHPFSVYWDIEKPMNEILEEVKEGQDLNWDFNEH